MVRALDRFDGRLAADDAAVAAAPVGRQDGLAPVFHVQHPLVAEDAEALGAAVAEVRRVLDHELPVVPQRRHVVGAGELVLVGPRVGPAQADGAFRERRAGDVVHQVDEVAAEPGHGPAGEVAEAVPAREADRVERLRAGVHQEFLPVDVLGVGLGDPAVPVGLRAVAVLLDAPDRAQDARAVQLAAACKRRHGPKLRADLRADPRGLHRVAGALELVEVHRERFLAVDVLAGLGGRLEVRRVLVVARGDHDGVDVLAGHHVTVRDERLRCAAAQFGRLRRGRLAPLTPRVHHGCELDVLALGVLAQPAQVRPHALAAAPDQRDANPLVRPRRPRIRRSRQRHRRPRRGFQNLTP